MSELTKSSQNYLIGIARRAIKSEFDGGGMDFGDIPDDVRSEAAAFVTLTIEGRLRGCIGTMKPIEEMYRAVASNARKAAFEDYRFNPLSREEYDKVEVHISILSELRNRRFKNAGEMVDVLGTEKPGVLLCFGSSRATFLPQVWGEIEGVEEFLTSLCQKAGLPALFWKEHFDDITLETYTVDEFGE